MTKLKTSYTMSEWFERQKDYTSRLISLEIPTEPTLAEVKELTSKLDTLYTEASFDFANIKSKYDIILGDLKRAEVGLFSELKRQEIDKGNKSTEKEIQSLVVNYIDTTKGLYNHNANLYDLRNLFSERMNFISMVMDNIKEKKQSIISIISVLKQENSFSAVNPKDYAYHGTV